MLYTTVSFIFDEIMVGFVDSRYTLEIKHGVLQT